MGLKLYAFLLGLYVLCLLFFTLPTLAITAALVLIGIVWMFWSVCYAVGEYIIHMAVSLIFMAFGK